MEEAIKKKETIYNQLIRKQAEGTLTQVELVDLKQELERCNHISNHVIRGYTNPAGQYTAMSIFGAAGFCYWLSTRPSKASLITIRSTITFFPYVLFPMVIATAWAKRRFGDRKEAKRFSQMRNDSLDIDDKFYEVLDSLKKEDLKHIA